MKKVLLLLIGFLSFANLAFAQKPFKTISPQKETTTENRQKPNNVFQASHLPQGQASFFDNTLNRFSPISLPADKSNSIQLGHGLKVVAFSPKGQPTWVEGQLDFDTRSISVEDQAFLYLDELKSQMGISNPMDEFFITSSHTDSYGNTHIRIEQQYKGLSIAGSEIILHAKDGKIIGLNGQYRPTPNLNIHPNFAQANAIDLVKADLSAKTPIIDWPTDALSSNYLPEHQVTADLVIYTKRDELMPHLAWQIHIYPNVTEQWLYWVDAHTGTVLAAYLNSCKFASDEHTTHAAKLAPKTKAYTPRAPYMDPLDGSADGNGLDLNSFNRSFKTYLVNSSSTYYLLDISRSMFNAGASTLPDEPAGGIFTINGNNGDPQSGSFQVSHLTSGSNSWADSKAVSAHYNAGLAYDYYKSTFTRNSINGNGGTIVSIINVTDGGQSMDNAFWNGQAMFYGNGQSAFKPLAGALDVAGHEMSHGVIGSTANLDYSYESGAINESFADIFGAMIDRDDWQMGEDVVFTSAFPSGALRDLSNPHNGGSQLGDPGFQPAHVNEQYQGSQDNGGVHINSGITNKAYYLIATEIGKDKAEQIYYKALTDYLTKHSDFKDLRIAILHAATDIHGEGSTEVGVVGPAFDAVGITGPNTGGGTTNPNNNYQDDLEANPGDDFIVYRNSNNSNKLALAKADGTILASFSSNLPSLSQPSVVDDGSVVVYIANDNTIHAIGNINWSTGAATESILDNNTDNRNVAISPDGKRMAVVTTNNDNKIWIYDFGLQAWKNFSLYNPTYDTEVKTFNVDYSDVLQFDFSGQFVMYDAQSTIQNNQGSDVSYWDVGMMRIWDNTNNTWSDGNIQKLFSGLPEGVSIGNPTFAKNSPYIIAFDYLEGENFSLRGANLETGESAQIATNDVVSRPSFAPSDQFLSADADQGDIKIYKVPLAASKYQYGTGSVQAIISAAGWGSWFANGTRSLTVSNEDILNDGKINIAPNPFNESISIQSVDGIVIQQVDIFDMQGRLIQTLSPRSMRQTIDFSNQPSGIFLIKILDDQGGLRLFKATKQ